MTIPSELRIEFRTVEKMIEIFCRDHHQKNGSLCETCRDLADYARQRLVKCPFREAKPTCGNCTVHCYKPEFREEVRRVMRYSGPRMSYRHPILALRHLMRGRKIAPEINAWRNRDRNGTGLNKSKIFEGGTK